MIIVFDFQGANHIKTKIFVFFIQQIFKEHWSDLAAAESWCW